MYVKLLILYSSLIGSIAGALFIPIRMYKSLHPKLKP